MAGLKENACTNELQWQWHHLEVIMVQTLRSENQAKSSASSGVVEQLRIVSNPLRTRNHKYIVPQPQTTAANGLRV